MRDQTPLMEYEEEKLRRRLETEEKEKQTLGTRTLLPGRAIAVEISFSC